MREKLVQALRDGCILAVNWQDIEEMLGEAPWRMCSVNVCNNAEVFLLFLGMSIDCPNSKSINNPTAKAGGLRR